MLVIGRLPAFVGGGDVRRWMDVREWAGRLRVAGQVWITVALVTAVVWVPCLFFMVSPPSLPTITTTTVAIAAHRRAPPRTAVRSIAMTSD